MTTGKASISEVDVVVKLLSQAKKEIGKVFFGQESIVDSLLRAVLCDGHVLLEGVPGVAKTLLIRTLASVSGCDFKRIQFTVDLLPSDIIGITTYEPHKGFETLKGPIFSHFVIADEINRSPPKTQSALIQAMQEKQVTIGRQTYNLPLPFFVMASQNPLESEGVYSLPEAQIDRFLLKLIFDYPDEESEARLMEENATFKKFEDYHLKEILSPSKIQELQKLTHRVYLDSSIKDYILRIVKRTRDKNFKYGDYLVVGASPRASIALYISSKAQALMNGRNYVIPQDVRNIAYDVLRHRLILSYKAQAERIRSETILEEVIRITESP